MSNESSMRKPHVAWEILTRLFLITYPLGLSFQLWLVNQIHGHDLSIQELRAWQGNMPKFSQADADVLRLKVRDELRSEMNLNMMNITAKLEGIQSTVIRLEERHKLANQ